MFIDLSHYAMQQRWALHVAVLIGPVMVHGVLD
jgi:hypothetical protein